MAPHWLLVLALVAPARPTHWAFRPLTDAPAPRLPASQPASYNPIDRFILARLEAHGLRPAPRADKRTLIRRATFDLIGLPPTPAEIDAFLKDDSPDAFAKVIDRLLSSPHYGERWGRHWLDVVRYADSNGMDENLVQANAWRYRDYVIRSFNADKPFDQFAREQIAGDLLAVRSAELGVRNEGENRELIVATGFLSLGPKMLAEDDPVKMEMDIVDEQVDAVGKAFLALTLGCARCHDHKFDPFTQADYYGLAGILRSTKTMNNFKVVAQWQERPVGTKEQVDRHQAHKHKIEEAKARLAEATLAAGVRVLTGRAAPPAAERRALKDAAAALEKSLPPLPEAMAVSEGKPADVRIHLRGNHLTLGAEVPRRFPVALAGARQASIDAGQSGRLQLADWLPRQPLFARVIANRVWHWHFGTGLVRSTDNFGTFGDSPSHPELLDWLAARLIADGWSLKALHRRIMLSATYQMRNEEKTASIPNSEFRIPHFQRRRLDAEEIRDALLAVGGNLDRTMGGTLLEGANRAYVPGYPNGIYEKYDFPRRSVYLPVLRSMLYDVFQAFDFPDPSTGSGERTSTTVAPQALFMLNGKLMAEQSRRLAESLLAAPGDDAGRVRLAYERAYGRPPTSAETARALDFVRRVGEAQKLDRPRAWQSLCRAILSANEFIFVE